MTDSTVVFTDVDDSILAGMHLGTAVADAFEGQPPQALIVFASARYVYELLLAAIHDACGPEVLLGCSSAGEFINRQQGEHSACAIGLRSSEITFAAGLGQGLRAGVGEAAEELIASFTGIGKEPTRFHSTLVLTDALAGRNDDLIEQLNVLTKGTYRFFGGGAGDDARFDRTHVFYGTEAYPDAAVALEMLSDKPLGLGVRHGWTPASGPLRVTASEGARLISLNAAPAVEAFVEHAAATGQVFNPEDPLSFFLHNVLGIDTGTGYQLRVPLSIDTDGSISCAADLPEGATVHVMQASNRSATEAAVAATEEALEQLQGHEPEVALFFDCVATRLRMGDEFGLELKGVEASLGEAKFAGCNTYGQVARASGQFSGFHNCTAVVCIIPA